MKIESFTPGGSSSAPLCPLTSSSMGLFLISRPSTGSGLCAAWGGVWLIIHLFALLYFFYRFFLSSPPFCSPPPLFRSNSPLVSATPPSPFSDPPPPPRAPDRVLFASFFGRRFRYPPLCSPPPVAPTRSQLPPPLQPPLTSTASTSAAPCA